MTVTLQSPTPEQRQQWRDDAVPSRGYATPDEWRRRTLVLLDALDAAEAALARVTELRDQYLVNREPELADAITEAISGADPS